MNKLKKDRYQYRTNYKIKENIKRKTSHQFYLISNTNKILLMNNHKMNNKNKKSNKNKKNKKSNKNKKNKESNKNKKNKESNKNKKKNNKKN